MLATLRAAVWSAILIASASRVPARDLPQVDAAAKEIVVTRVASIMTDKYVEPETGRKMADHILSRHAHGAYEAYPDVKSFCSALTSDLRSISNDKHLFVFYSPDEAREVAARNGLLSEDEIEEIEKQYYESMRRRNFGFRRVEILDGNVGYLDLRVFPSITNGSETASAAMALLANTDAIIIDLRENGGGEKDTVQFLSSYFFAPASVELNGEYYRESDSVKRSWTLPYVPGKRLPHVELYILTSTKTFSAAEDFAYGLQQLGRAVVVGESTKGGAHPVDVLIVEGDILTQVSVGESINPITKTNWEGQGVQPDLEISAEKALSAAHHLALERLHDKTTDPGFERN